MARTLAVRGARLGSGQLAVANPLAALHLAVPDEVQARPGRILWRVDEWRPGLRVEGALAAFLRLSGETDDVAFSEFAKRYGVLGLGRDGSPHTSTGDMPPHAGDGPGAWFKEVTADWRVYARHAKALLALYNALRGDGRIDPEHVLVSKGLWPEPEAPQRPDTDTLRRKRISPLITNLNAQDSRDGQRLWLGNALSREWLSLAAIAPRVAWGARERPYVELTLGNPYLSPGWQILSTTELAPLFSVLAVQLADVFCGDRNLVDCPLCQGMFVPSHHREVYCGNCKTTAKTRRQGRWRSKESKTTLPAELLN